MDKILSIHGRKRQRGADIVISGKTWNQSMVHSGFRWSSMH